MNKIFTLILIALFSASISIAKPIEKQKKASTLFIVSDLDNIDKMAEFNRNLIQQVKAFNSGITTPLKSAAFKQKLDSTVTKSGFPLEKEEFVYNSNGNCTLYTKKTKYFEEDEWLLFIKNEYTYNSAGFQTLASEWELDATSENLVLVRKTETTYNANNQATVVIEWDDDNDLHTFMRETKVETSYNVNGKIIMYGSTWNASTSSWVEKTKTEMQIVNQRISKSEFYNKTDQGNWSLYSSTDFSYDTHGNITSTIIQAYSIIEQKLVNSYKSENTYYASNLEKSDKDYLWDSSKSSWNLLSQYEYEYNTKGQKSKTTYSTKNVITNLLEISNVEEITFDSNFNPKTKTVSYSDGMGGLFQVEKETYNFSTAYNFNTLVLPSSQLMFDDYEYYMNGRLDKVTESANDESTWIETKATDYYYSSSLVTVGFTDVVNNFKVYPNPTTDYLQIDAGTNEKIDFSLYDMSGKNILSGSGLGSAQVSLKNRNRGLYLIDIKIGNTVSKRVKIEKN